MTEETGGTGAEAHPRIEEGRSAFPWTRLFYAIGFAVLGWFVFWFVLLLGLLQFIVTAVSGRVNEELKSFSLSLVQYLWELLAFVTFVRDEKPFPLGPFPKG